VVKEVCEDMVDEYKDEVLKCPSTSEDWRPLTDKFASRWNLPHACGAIDGKHTEHLIKVAACITSTRGSSLLFSWLW
jgi:hypothetical protein